MNTSPSSCRLRKSFALANLVALGIILVPLGLRAQQLTIVDGQSDLLDPATYGGTAPTTTSDVTWAAGSDYYPTLFTINDGASLSIRSLNKFSTAFGATIRNDTSGISTLILNGGGNTVAPNSNDLIYLDAASPQLTISSNSRPGSTTLNVLMPNAGNLNINTFADISAHIISPAALVKTGVGILSLSGSNSGMTGGLTIAEGGVSVGGQFALGATNNVVTLGSGTATATLYIVGGGAAAAAQPPIIVTPGGLRSIVGSNNGSLQLGNVTMNNDLHISSTGGNREQFGLTSLSGTGNLILESATINSGGMRIAGASTDWSGTTFINVSSLAVSNANALGSGPILLGATSGTNDAIFKGSGDINFSKAITVRAGSTGRAIIQNSEFSGFTYSGDVTMEKDLYLGINYLDSYLRLTGNFSGTGNINIIGVSAASTIGVEFGDTSGHGGLINNTGAITIGGSVASSTYANPIIFQGSAAIGANVTGLIQNQPFMPLYLRNSNPLFSGSVAVNAGRVNIENATALSAKNLVAIASSGTFDVRNVDLTIAGLNNVSGTGGLVTHTTGGARTLTLGGDGNYSFKGRITAGNPANLSLVKSGAGTQFLSGTNTYAGTTTVSGGVLIFGSKTSLYNNTPANWTAGKLIVNSGATMAFNVGGAGEFTSADLDILKGLGTSTGGFRNGAFLGLDTTNAAGGNFAYSSAIANPNGGSNALGLAKLGSGTLTLTGNNTYTGGTVISAGTLKVGDGGTSGSLDGNVSIAAAASLVFDRSDDLAFAGAVSGAGSLTKRGEGTLELTGNSNYAGLTSVAAGTLIVNGDNSAAVGDVVVAGKLGGSGTIGGATTIQDGGTLSPGNSPGTLTIDNHLTLEDSAIALFEGNDLVDVNGQLALSENWTLTLTTGFQDGGSVVLFTYDSFNGAGLAPTFDISGLGFTPSGPLSLSDTGSAIVLNGISAVPEPSALALMTTGLLGAIAFRRRPRIG